MALTVKRQSHDHEPDKCGRPPCCVICHHPMGINDPHSYKNVTVYKPELFHHLQPVLTLPLEQPEETLGPTHSSGSAKVEPRTLKHLCFVWVEATHQICQIPGCPSRPALLHLALSNSPPQKDDCLLLCSLSHSCAFKMSLPLLHQGSLPQRQSQVGQVHPALVPEPQG